MEFTLRVQEPDKADKQFLVSLVVRPRLTGSAIFAVDYAQGGGWDGGGGGHTRITADNVDEDSNETYTAHEEAAETP
jgi:hypothetical protein